MINGQKLITVIFADGVKYTIPALAVAHVRAAYLADNHSEEGDGTYATELSDTYKSDYELEEWLLGNSDWTDWETFATLTVGAPSDTSSYSEDWCNTEIKVGLCEGSADIYFINLGYDPRKEVEVWFASLPLTVAAANTALIERKRPVRIDLGTTDADWVGHELPAILIWYTPRAWDGEISELLALARRSFDAVGTITKAKKGEV